MFRDNLKEQIEYKGMIIKELAAKTGISKRTIDTYVDSRAVIPNAEIAVKLAEALDTSVEYLVKGYDPHVKPDIPKKELGITRNTRGLSPTWTRFLRSTFLRWRR